MNKMIYYIIPLILLIIIAFRPFTSFGQKDLNKYKFLFRNDIFSHTKDETKTGETAFQLAPVMRGKAYRPFYLYFPEREQYLIYSSLEPFGFRRYDAYAPPHEKEVTSHVLLNNKGQVIQRLDSHLRYSARSGMFFTQGFYVNWLETGDTTQLPYAGVYNQDITMNSTQFADKFRELYAQADYIEYVNLRTQHNDRIGKGVVFKIKQEWHILLDPVYDSHIYSDFNEDEKTGVDVYTYKVKFDYYDPDRKLANPYPQSPPLVKSVYLETKDSRPYGFNRWASHSGLKLMKYQKLSTTGWHGIAKIHGIGIYVPGTGEGVAYMRYKIGKQSLYFKALDIVKYDYLPIYSLGIRSFKMPSHVRVKDPLVFIESLQNYSHEYRIGGGIFVVRPCTNEASNTSSLPEGLSEGRYARLPISLQVALMDIEGTNQLKTEAWHPEITLLQNLKYLKITGEVDTLHDDISTLKELEVLDLSSCGIQSISTEIAKLKHLKILNLYANCLMSFPEEICELKELTHLNISANKIAEIPQCIDDLTNLIELKLQFLNDLSLPETMLNMKHLKIKDSEELRETLPERFHFLFEE